jgi:putative inorganic carbon (HCO3(-)) transporter
VKLEELAAKALPVLFFLYALSLLVSMAGMEIFSWTTAAVVLVVAMIQIIKHRQTIGEVFLFADFALFGLLIVIILGAFLTAPPSPPAQSTLDIIGSARWILLFYLLRLGLHWSFHDNAQYAFNTLLTIAGIVGIYAITQHFTGVDLIRHDHVMEILGNREDGSPIYRSAGFFSGPMRYGNSFGLLVFFPIAALMTIKHKSKLFKNLMIFSAVFISLSLVTTLVRGVWLGVIAGIIVMCLYAGRRKGFAIFTFMMIVVLGIGFGVESVRHRAEVAVNNFSMDDSRIKIWRANIAMFKDHPILGVGNNQNEAIVGDYFTKLNITDGQIGHAHNTYLQFLSGTGILGLLCYMIFIIYFLVISHRLLRMIPERFEWHRALVLGAIGAQVFLHVGGLTEPSFKHAEVKHMFLFILALVATIYCKYRNEHTLLIRRPANEGPGYHGV